MRGDKADYDLWGEILDDKRWNYSGFLPYFRKTEKHYDNEADPEIHGLTGPIQTESIKSSGRQFPLRSFVEDAWAAEGVLYNPDKNSGNPIGLGEHVANHIDGTRQFAGVNYPLDVSILTETLAEKVIIEQQNGKQVATGIVIEGSGKFIRAGQEVILSAGAYRSPQILMLSGIGPASHLQEHDIDVVLDLPVGHNFHDHPSVSQWWKLKEPSDGLAVGSAGFNAKELKSLPLDFVVTQPVPLDGLKAALVKDGNVENINNHPLLTRQLGHVETYINYVAFNPENPKIPLDGSHITSGIVCMLPTSRGIITLANKDPTSAPLIDPNYASTEVDRYMLREGLKKLYRVMQHTPAGQATIEGQTVTEGYLPISLDISDEEIDRFIRSQLT